MDPHLIRDSLFPILELGDTLTKCDIAAIANKLQLFRALTLRIPKIDKFLPTFWL